MDSWKLHCSYVYDNIRSSRIIKSKGEEEEEEVGDTEAQLGVDCKILCIYLQKVLYSLMEEFHIYQSG